MNSNLPDIDHEFRSDCIAIFGENHGQKVYVETVSKELISEAKALLKTLRSDISKAALVTGGWKLIKTQNHDIARLIVDKNNATVAWIGHGNDQKAKAIAEYILSLDPEKE